MTRRNFLAAAAGAGTMAFAAPSAPMPKLSVFTKHLQFLDGDALAAAIAEIGAEGADLSLRKGGHVEPERVKQDLPPLLKALDSHEIELTMATTDIVDASSPFAEPVLQMLSENGVRHYRWGGFKFDPAKPILDQIESLKARVEKLAALNRKYNLTAIYHTHSGVGQIGAAIWDLHLLLKDFDPRLVAVNYDIGHATVEGGFGGWIESLNVTGRHLRGVALKDILWAKNARTNEWRPEWRPIGEGMVRFTEFFRFLKAMSFTGPVQVHFEYPLGGAESGKRIIGMPKEQVIAAMRKDCTAIRELWKPIL
jgi:sugar phosphate isomerase/epimerase